MKIDTKPLPLTNAPQNSASKETTWFGQLKSRFYGINISSSNVLLISCRIALITALIWPMFQNDPLLQSIVDTANKVPILKRNFPNTFTPSPAADSSHSIVEIFNEDSFNSELYWGVVSSCSLGIYHLVFSNPFPIEGPIVKPTTYLSTPFNEKFNAVHWKLSSSPTYADHWLETLKLIFPSSTNS